MLFIIGLDNYRSSHRSIIVQDSGVRLLGAQKKDGQLPAAGKTIDAVRTIFYIKPRSGSEAIAGQQVVICNGRVAEWLKAPVLKTGDAKAF